MEAGLILLGISLSDLKVKLQLSSPHCLWNDSLERDLSILQTLVPFVCHHTLSDSASGHVTSHKQLFNYSDHTCCYIFFLLLMCVWCRPKSSHLAELIYLLKWTHLFHEHPVISFQNRRMWCEDVSAAVRSPVSSPCRTAWWEMASGQWASWPSFSSSVTRVVELLPNVRGR